LNLHARRIRDPRAEEAFAEARSRINALATLHRRLYESESLQEIDLHWFLEDLCAELRRGGLSRGRNVELVVESPSEVIGPELAVPLGLLVTEAITNAYKHAFADRTHGRITVQVERDSPEYLLIRIRDDGSGFDPENLSTDSTGLGRSLIDAFVRQLHGELEIKSDNGTVVEVRFPAPVQLRGEVKRTACYRLTVTARERLSLFRPFRQPSTVLSKVRQYAPSMSKPSRRAALRVLAHADFRHFLVARLLATLAAQMQIVAVGWQLYEITRDPLDLGLIGLSQFVPFVLLILPAGQSADHYDRRRILMLCYALEGLCALLLLAYTIAEVRVAWPVFAAMLLLGGARAFSMPSGQALLPNLVPHDDFTRAVALNSSVYQIATVVGPALGGVLYLAGPQVVYSSVLALAVIAALLMIR